MNHVVLDPLHTHSSHLVPNLRMRFWHRDDSIDCLTHGNSELLSQSLLLPFAVDTRFRHIHFCVIVKVGRTALHQLYFASSSAITS